MLSDLYKTNQFAEFRSTFQPMVSRTKKGSISFKYIPSGKIYTDVDTRTFGIRQTGGASSEQELKFDPTDGYPDIFTMDSSRRNPVSRPVIKADQFIGLADIKTTRNVFVSVWVDFDPEPSMIIGTGPYPQDHHDTKDRFQIGPGYSSEDKLEYLQTHFPLEHDRSISVKHHVVMNNEQKNEFVPKLYDDCCVTKFKGLFNVDFGDHTTDHLSRFPELKNQIFIDKLEEVLSFIGEPTDDVQDTVREFDYGWVSMHDYGLKATRQNWMKKRYKYNVWFPLPDSIQPLNCGVIEVSRDKIEVHIK